MLKKTYFKAAGMFLCVGLYLFGFSYSLSGKDKPFEMKLIKEFKTGKEYEAYKKAHLEVFGVKEGEEKRIKIEGDRIRFYDEKGNLIRERRVYQGKEVFEGKDKYGKIEKFRLYSDFYISPKGDLVVEQRWKGPPPPSEEPGWVEKAIIYNGRGEITGEINVEGISPFILPEPKYIIGIKRWPDRKVHVYDMKGVIVKTIEFDIEYSDVAYAKISNDGEYALICYSDADGSDAEIVLIDKDINIIWKKMCKPERLSEESISSFGEYTAVILGKNNGEELIVWDKKGKMVYKREISNVYMSDIRFLNTTRILIYEEYTNRNNPVFMVFLDPVTGEELYRYKIKGYDWGADMEIKVSGNILAIGSGATEEDKDFGSRSYISLFHWKASDEMFLKGGGR